MPEIETPKPEQGLAFVLAYLFTVLGHPLLMPSYLIGFLLYYLPGFVHHPLEVRWKLLLLVFIVTFALPAILIKILQAIGLVKDNQITNPKERFIPYMLTAVCYAFGVYLMRSIGLGFLSETFVFGATIAVCGVAFINFFTKISAHATGLGGVIAYLAVLLPNFDVEGIQYIYAGLLVFMGCVLSSRLHFQAHNLWQILLGLVWGASVSLATLYGIL